MTFSTKTAIVLDVELAMWQKVNAAALLASGLAGDDPSLVGEEFVDASGNHYLGVLREPILVYGGDRAGVRRAYERALAREVEQLAIFTRDLFATPNYEINRAAVAARRSEQLELVGIAVRANRKTIDRIFDKLHPLG